MAITVQCPSCEKMLQVADEAAGKIYCCPACESVFEIPMPGEDFVPAELVDPDLEESGITANPAMPARNAVTDVRPPAKPKKKSQGDDEDQELYGFDADDADEREDRERTRVIKEKRRRLYEDVDRERNRRRFYQPHQGVLLLVLSIVAMCGACLCAFVGWGLGPIILGMANTDLAKMDNGAMDPEGRSLTTAAKVFAIISVGIGLVNCIAGVAIRLRSLR